MSAPGRSAGAGGAGARVTALLAERGVDGPLSAVTDLGAHLGVVQGGLADRSWTSPSPRAAGCGSGGAAAGRRWGEERGIGVPEVLAAADDGRWLLSRRVHALPAGNPRWAEAAIEAAVRIAPLPGPQGEPPSRAALGRARG